MATVFLHGTFAGNRGDILMHDAAMHALVKRSHIPTEDAVRAEVILDCCGYWCGDPWGPWRSEEMATKCEEWKQEGKTVILLPQTFGPFDDQRIRDAAKRIVEAADLVCARDQQSEEYLTAIAGNLPSVVSFPDYTIDVEPVPSSIFQPHGTSVAIIPNLRMIDKTTEGERDAYIPFLQKCIRMIRSMHAEPFLLIHEEKDALFADQLDADLTVVREPDARKTKWIIRQSHAVVSSRYHGILNALYQNVPVLATGWCHKFPALMEEWEMADRLIDVRCGDEQLRAHVTELLDGAPRSHVSVQTLYREKTAELWATVEAAIGDPAILQT